MSQAGIVNVADGGTTVVETLTGNSGGAVPPTSSNINTVGTGSITIVGDPSTSTLTTELTGLTSHNVLIGAGTATITKVAPSATSGVPLISQGSSSDPAFGTAVVAGGGTGDTSFTAYAPITGGTTTTGALQSASTGLSTANYVFTSNGGSALPSFQAVSASGAITTITGNSGGAESPSGGNFNIVGTGSITTVGSANTETIELTGLTNHNVLVGAGSATVTKVAPSATAGIPLVSGGSSADPSFTTAVVAGGGTGANTLTGILTGNGTSAVTANAVTQHGILIGGASNAASSLGVATNGQLAIGSTGADPVLATLASAGGTVAITNGAGSINLEVASSVGVVWAANANTTISVTPGNGYIITAATAITATLPTSGSPIGSLIGFTIAESTAALTISYGTGQHIRMGNQVTTTTSGSLVSTNDGDTVMLVCTAAASGSAGTWHVIQSMGNWTVN